MDRKSNLPGDGHKANRRTNRCTNTQQRSDRGQNFTKFDVLIVSEKQDDVGPDVAHVAVPLETRPGAMYRQVSRALGRREDSRQDQEEQRERGEEPPPRHYGNL